MNGPVPAPRPGIAPWLVLPGLALMAGVLLTDRPLKNVLLAIQLVIVAVQVALTVRYVLASRRWRRGAL